MAGSDPKIQLDITAKDDASKKIDAVAEAAEGLEKLSPEVEVTADTAAAKADLGAVADAAATLSKADTTLVIKAQIDQAKADLRALETQLRGLDDVSADTGRKIGTDIESGTSKAASATHSMAGNVIGDSAAMATGFGPLGEAVGQLTEGILGGEVAFKDLVVAGGAMAGIALVVKTVTDALAESKAVDAFNKKKVDDFTEALREGRTVLETLSDELRDTGKVEFADQVTGKTKDLVGVLADADIQMSDFLDHVRGGKDAFREWVIANGEAIGAGDGLNSVIQAGNQFIDDAAAASKAYTDQQKVMGVTAAENAREHRGMNAVLIDGAAAFTETAAAAGRAAAGVKAFRTESAKADGAYSALTGVLDEQDAWANVNAQIDDYNAKTEHSEQQTRDQIRAIGDYVAETDTIPAAKKTEILALLKEGGEGSVVAATAELDALTVPRQVRLDIILAGSKDIIANLGARGPGGSPVATSAPAVTINMPRGARGVDVVRQISGSARRSGRRYGAAVITHARR